MNNNTMNNNIEPRWVALDKGWYSKSALVIALRKLRYELVSLSNTSIKARDILSDEIIEIIFTDHDEYCDFVCIP